MIPYDETIPCDGMKPRDGLMSRDGMTPGDENTGLVVIKTLSAGTE